MNIYICFHLHKETQQQNFKNWKAKGPVLINLEKNLKIKLELQKAKKQYHLHCITPKISGTGRFRAGRGSLNRKVS